jgi:two-component system, chemotaxis family, sensor kinase CheA
MDLSPAELAELQGIFKAECEEHLTALNGLLMTLERNPRDAEALNEAFRRMHSVKGAARMVGLQRVENIAHAFEAMLAQVRDGKRQLSKSDLHLLFRGTDAINDMTTAGGSGASAEPAIVALLESLGLTNGHAMVGAAAPTDDESKAVSASAPTEFVTDGGGGGEIVRIGADKIDKLIALRGELVRTLSLEDEELNQLGALIEDTVELADRIRVNANSGSGSGSGLGSGSGSGSGTGDIAAADLRRRREQLRDALGRMSERNVRRSSRLEELRDSLADLRMLPASTILQNMHRVVRDVADNQGKEAELIIAGADVAIDKVVLDALKEPLIHIIRNAVAHGIERPQRRVSLGKPAKGTVRITASTGTSSATIVIEDDGAGIDFERVRDTAIANGFVSSVEAQSMSESKLVALLFKPGFSTTSDADTISGRGVGLDVVADRIAQLRGSYLVESVLGQGTRISLRVPVSLLTSSVLAVNAGTLEVCLRQTDIREAVLLKPESVVNVDGRITATIRDEVMPVVPLASVGGSVDAQVYFGSEGFVPAIIIEHGERKCALVVDELAGVSDVIVKPLPRPLGNLAGVAGYAILGSGVPLCVLDGEHLVRAAHDRGMRGAVVHARTTVKRSLLIADDSLTTRTLLRNIMLSAGYDVETAVDGVDAWAKVQQRKFDCIMSDIEMPNMNGWEFCERLKRDATLSETPLVLITSLSKDEERRRGLALGADAYIVKGLFNETQLLETVERLVA